MFLSERLGRVKRSSQHFGGKLSFFPEKHASGESEQGTRCLERNVRQAVYGDKIAKKHFKRGLRYGGTVKRKAGMVKREGRGAILSGLLGLQETSHPNTPSAAVSLSALLFPPHFSLSSVNGASRRGDK